MAKQWRGVESPIQHLQYFPTLRCLIRKASLHYGLVDPLQKTFFEAQIRWPVPARPGAQTTQHMAKPSDVDRHRTLMMFGYVCIYSTALTVTSSVKENKDVDFHLTSDTVKISWIYCIVIVLHELILVVISLFSGCGELACRTGLFKGGTRLSLPIHHHGVVPTHSSNKSPASCDIQTLCLCSSGDSEDILQR